MSGCEQFPDGSRQRAICEGMANLPLYKINKYRERWGLPPLEQKPEGAEEVPALAIARPARSNGQHEMQRKGKRTVNPTRPKGRQPRRRLGDYVEATLSAVGITEKRVSRVLRRPCGCGGRKQKLNEVHAKVEETVKKLFGRTV